MKNPERINVRNIRTPERVPEEPLTFDPERDITPKLREELRAERDRTRATGVWIKYIQIGSAFQLLGEVDSPLNDEEKRQVERTVQSVKNDSTRSSFFGRCLARAHLLHALPNGVSSVDKEVVAKDLVHYSSVDTPAVAVNFLDVAAQLKMLGAFDATILDGTWRLIGEHLEEYRKSEDWFHFSKAAALARIVNPRKLYATPEDWVHLREELRSLQSTRDLTARDFSLYDLSEYAARLNILAADAVNVSGDSFTLIKSKRNREEKTHPVPDALQLP